MFSKTTKMKNEIKPTIKNISKEIIIPHQEQTLDFAKTTYSNIIFRTLEDTWFLLDQPFKDVSENNSKAKIRGFINNEEMHGEIDISCKSQVGGFITLSLYAA